MKFKMKNKLVGVINLEIKSIEIIIIMLFVVLPTVSIISYDPGMALTIKTYLARLFS